MIKEQKKIVEFKKNLVDRNPICMFFISVVQHLTNRISDSPHERIG